MKRTSLEPEYDILQLLLREIRRSAGLNQQQIAERLGEPQSFISKYESGERRLDVIELRQICIATGISFIDFIVLLETRLNQSKDASG